MYKLYNLRLKLFPTDTGAGTPGAANAQQSEPGTAGATDAGDDEGDDKDDPKKKPVTLTQDEIDRMINRAFKRGARSAEKTPAATPAASPDTKTDKGAEDAEKKAAKLLEKANETLLKGTVRGLAADFNLTDKGAKAAERLADFTACFDKNGELDEEEVKSVLEDFAKEYPEFVKNPDDEQPRRIVAGSLKTTKKPAFDSALRAAMGLKQKE